MLEGEIVMPQNVVYCECIGNNFRESQEHVMLS